MKKFFVILLSIFFVGNFFSSNVYAKIETCTGTGEYIMSMKETPEFAQQNAKLYAEREALEQAGVFINSWTEVKNNIVNKDEITAFAVGLLKNVKVIKTEMISLTGEGQGYIKVRVIVEAQIDSDDFETALKDWQNRDGKERSKLVEQNNSQQQLIEDLQKKIATLEKDLENAKTSQQKEKVQNEIKEIDKDALYIQKIDEGIKLLDKNDFNGAIKIFDEAVKLNPNDYQGYFGRGTAYGELKNYEKSLQDLNKAIQLNPNYEDAYYNIGRPYFIMKNYVKEIESYTKVIQLNPNNAGAYHWRGVSYQRIGDNAKAQADFAKAKSLSWKE